MLRICLTSFIIGFMTVSSILPAAELKDKTVEAWERYVALTEARIDRELADEKRFLVTDFLPKKDATKCGKMLASGDVYVTDLESRDSHGDEVEVPDGTISHWLGSVRIPNAKLDSILSFVQNYDIHERYFADVEQSRLINRDADTFQFFYRLKQETTWVTVHYNTTHTVRYRRHTPQRVSSASRTTRINELENPGTAEEREKPEGNDSGFMWRLNSYWRFEQDGDGVVVTLESLTLSRKIPLMVFFVKPIVNRISRGLLENTLLELRTGYHTYLQDTAKAAAKPPEMPPKEP